MSNHSEIEALFEKLGECIKVQRQAGVHSPALLDELAVRLEQLHSRYIRCMSLNDECLNDAKRMLPRYDPTREAFVIEKNGQLIELYRINRAHPDKPVVIGGSTVSTGFVPGSTADGPKPYTTEKAEKELSSELENFYYAASRYWDLLEKEILKKKKSKYIGVKMVRNQLLEHAMSGAINSFGASDLGGPKVKPIRKSNLNDGPMDKGLAHNTVELLVNAIERLS